MSIKLRLESILHDLNNLMIEMDKNKVDCTLILKGVNDEDFSLWLSGYHSVETRSLTQTKNLLRDE